MFMWYRMETGSSRSPVFSTVSEKVNSFFPMGKM